MSGNGKVMVAYPYGTIHADFHHCLLKLKDYDHVAGKRRLQHGEWLCATKSNNLASARNSAVRTFLDSSAEWLLFIDTDQTFDPDLIERMVASADPVARPILSALIVAKRDEERGFEPACAGIDEHGVMRAFIRPAPVRHWECVPGCGVLLIHRTVLEAVGEKRKDTSFPWFEFAPWERVDSETGETIHDVMGEDYTFILRANGLGFRSFVDTTIECGHVKSDTWIPSKIWPEIVPDETFVIIPVKDKLELTKSILRQLHEQGHYSAIFVMDNGSDAHTKGWLRKQKFAEVFDCAGLGIHEMWNRGAVEALKRSRKTNLAFLNNDLSIGPEMLGTLADALRQHEVAAVCPNYDGRPCDDPGDVVQLKGICANRYDGTGGLAGFCFMVRGEVFRMGYRFPEDAKWWYGDNDLTLTLDQNGMPYAMVHGTTVEHLDGGGQTGEGWVNYEDTEQGKADLAAFLAKWQGVKVEAAA